MGIAKESKPDPSAMRGSHDPEQVLKASPDVIKEGATDEIRDEAKPDKAALIATTARSGSLR